MEKKIIIAVATIFIVGILVWVYFESNKPQPGQKIADLGRDHVDISTKVDYSSNPPTSGAHNADWTRAGVYELPRKDAYLVHSLEHGYVIISYNCAKRSNSLIPKAFAHGVEEEATEAATPNINDIQIATESADLPQAFKADECHSLVDQLISVYEKKGKRKLVVIPRPNLDARIALTAWGRVDKFEQFDQKRIEKFIDAYRDQGPEKTME